MASALFKSTEDFVHLFIKKESQVMLSKSSSTVSAREVSDLKVLDAEHAEIKDNH